MEINFLRALIKKIKKSEKKFGNMKKTFLHL